MLREEPGDQKQQAAEKYVYICIWKEKKRSGYNQSINQSEISRVNVNINADNRWINIYRDDEAKDKLLNSSLATYPYNPRKIVCTVSDAKQHSNNEAESHG